MQSIFVTGAAHGIGRAVAQKFLNEGWKVGAYDIAPIDYNHENLVTGHLDVTKASDWEEALADFTKRVGRIDVVDNNAGIIIDGPLQKATPEEIERIIAVNCLGVTLGARYAHSHLSPKGTLVNMSSAGAIYGQPDIAAYSASKFYVKGLTEALNLEWSGDGIRVIDINPLWAKTELANVNAKSVRRLGIKIEPEEVANAIWIALHPRNRIERGKVHYGVSTTDKMLSTAREIASPRIAKILTRVVSK